MTRSNLALTGEMLLSGGSIQPAGDERDDGLAGVVRLDGGARTPSGATAVTGWLEAQVGRDPRTFGRGGLGPSAVELERTIGAPISAGTLDRLFLGPELAHVSGELLFEQWIVSELAVDLGVFGRLPLSAADRRSLRPSTLEVWLGPEMLLAGGLRAALEARLSFEDPGASGRVFARDGDGVRRSSSLRLYAEIPLELSEQVLLSIRPEGEAFLFTTSGPLTRAENERGFAAGLLATLRIAGFSVAARYDVSALPAFGGDGVATIHEIELWLGGTY